MTASYVKPKFGSVQYYKEKFDDTLCDIECNSNEADNILEALVSSIEEWASYHKKQAESYKAFGVKLAERLNAI